MSGVLFVGGYGSGISKAVATKFGKQGFKLALVSRTQSRLDAAAAEFAKEGITAKGFAADLSSFADVKSVFPKIKAELGPTTIVFWNPYGAPKGFLEVTEEELVHEFKVDVSGLVAAVQAGYEDLKSQAGEAAVLITGGGASLENDPVAQFAADFGWTTFATAKAAQRKLAHILNKGLAKDGIYAAEVTVMATVRGTQFESGDNTISADDVANYFWETYSKRDVTTWAVPAFPRD